MTQRTIRVVAAVLEKDGRYLITQRRASAVLPLMWEFPGGRVEEGETDVQALRREVRHRLGAQIEVGKLISFVSHPYEHYVVDLFLYACVLALLGRDRRQERARLQVGHERRVRPATLRFTPADEASMNKLLGL